ncbi:receptor-activated Ca2+-permeable cation channel [Microthyrium microscopicum]|uniref:Receptor-activated Ca2+-permeable cation channel n=1 Tax=Microthyrium microscopicum TaxID=703497 RepID=A0A6A6TWK3_9PEZI|nr:receptor-activated Ca2+-permeable cation channel [Microthyrium microscopicum]
MSINWSFLNPFKSGNGPELRAQMQSLLPTRRERIPPSAIPAKEVTIIALRLKHQIEVVIPCELDEERVTQPHSNVITEGVIETAKSAGGSEHKGAVIFCLMMVKKWFKRQAILELWDADLHLVRATACEVIAKEIIEAEEDLDYLMEEVLLKRYSIIIDMEETAPANAVEKAVDLHALRVIGSSGYQKCISYLYRGWIMQDPDDPARFIQYKARSNTSYWKHLDPDRMRVPVYQNAMQIIISVLYLAFYTGAINTINPSGDLDAIEGLLYIFTLGFMCDEFGKLFKIGLNYIQFWNIFNSTLYLLLMVSFVLRMVALGNAADSDDRAKFNVLSYNFLACCAPLFWGRLLLYLDTVRFIGAMIIVISRMMRESLIFFALLVVICLGFLQAFVGLDQVDNELTAVKFVTKAMLNAIMTSPEFDGFDSYAPPFGLILYYIYTFVVMVILLNILIALYNSAYEDITDNATDEYLALFAQKTLQFVRAPDENVFIPPFNLIEIFFLILPLEWWMSKKAYERLNDYIMATIYSPLLFITAAVETRAAHVVKSNRRRSAEDDDTIEEWEQLAGECDFEEDGWAKKVEATKPNVEVDGAIIEMRKLKKEVDELKDMISQLLKEKKSPKNGGKS